MTDSPPTVAVVHATPAAMAPAADAFATAFPQARIWNLLDDLLLKQAEQESGITAPLRRRMSTLIGYAVDGGADAVLLSCSLYGPVAQELAPAYPVPVLASDQALFEEVARRRPARVTVLGPVRGGVDDTVARLRTHLAAASVGGKVAGAVVGGARTAGDGAALAQLVGAAAQRVRQHSDLVLLGQFSLAPGLAAARDSADVPVLSAAHVAATALRRRLGAEATP
ncbi:hypothetical protein [Micromonospora sp. SL4-19]|uniref:hypothetical protein n=1 Tax=Micromonospora sp. SL4-19 TaxID=3399129 RepID=UPI003A4E57E0